MRAGTDTNNVATVTFAPPGTPLWDTTFTNFAPRFGLAYKLNDSGNMVLRGGFGVFYDLPAGTVSNIVIGAGYQVFFLNGVALAPNQLTSTNFDIFSNTITPGRTGRPINDNNNIFFHGPSVGVEITWGGGKREHD